MEERTSYGAVAVEDGGSMSVILDDIVEPVPDSAWIKVEPTASTKFSLWHSVAKDGYPPESQIVLVTYDDGRDSKCVDAEHRWKDGKWQEFYDNDWEDVFLGGSITAWIPYPAPYEGD